MKSDLVLLHPPAFYDFRKELQFRGPISDAVPSTSVFEMYPIGFTSIGGYLDRHGIRVRIVNLANRMLLNEKFDVEKKIRSLDSLVFGIDLHWLPHVQGCLKIAELVKKVQPESSVILGGLSATYFHSELMKYDFVDYVMRGDSTEIPLLKFMQAKKSGKTDFSEIPNLCWKNGSRVIVNSLTFIPSDLSYTDIPDYRFVIKSAVRHLDYLDGIPYKNWIKFPNAAFLTTKGCTYNCAICGGSESAFEINCLRRKLVMYPPEKICKGIRLVQKFTRSPIYIVGDIRQGGSDYVSKLLDGLHDLRVKNEIIFELFDQGDDEFFSLIERSLPKYSLEMTVESWDENIRRKEGKLPFPNNRLIETFKAALKHNVSRIEIFFMIGLPGQTYENTLKNVDFCEEIFNACGRDKRLNFIISPLGPFLDPASAAFEHPEMYGYKSLCRTIDDHLKISAEPSWKDNLSFETEYMDRDTIAKATYDSALKLYDFKYRCGIVTENVYSQVVQQIKDSLDFMEALERLKNTASNDRQKMISELKSKLIYNGKYSIYGENEPTWESSKNYLKFAPLLALGVGYNIKDFFAKIQLWRS